VEFVEATRYKELETQTHEIALTPQRLSEPYMSPEVHANFNTQYRDLSAFLHLIAICDIHNENIIVNKHTGDIFL
jgi:hypothetical protein